VTDVFNSWVPRWFVWVTGLGAAMGAVLTLYNLSRDFRASGEVSSLGLLIAGMSVFLALTLGTWIWNRMRTPLLVIDDEVIQFSAYSRSIRPAMRIPVAEIEALMPSKGNTVVLRLRSGKVRRFTLFELRRSDRKAAREAIQRRISAASA